MQHSHGSLMAWAEAAHAMVICHQQRPSWMQQEVKITPSCAILQQESLTPPLQVPQTARCAACLCDLLATLNELDGDELACAQIFAQVHKAIAARVQSLHSSSMQVRIKRGTGVPAHGLHARNSADKCSRVGSPHLDFLEASVSFKRFTLLPLGLALRRP